MVQDDTPILVAITNTACEQKQSEKTTRSSLRMSYSSPSGNEFSLELDSDSKTPVNLITAFIDALFND